MWSKINKINPAWYFDATGSILKGVNGQNRNYLYSIVCRHSQKKLIVPIFEFCTTSHNYVSISRNLFAFKKELEMNLNDELRIASFVVVVFHGL